MFKCSNRRGQSTLEYAVIIAVVVAGLVAMQTYFKRGFMGRIRSSTDDIGSQFDPDSFTSNYETRTGSLSTERLAGGLTTSNIQSGWQRMNGGEGIGNYEDAE